LDFRDCDPKHKWYQAYPIREGWGRAAGETASEGGRWGHFGGWEGSGVECLVEGVEGGVD
jgi:hypothetical protein